MKRAILFFVLLSFNLIGFAQSKKFVFKTVYGDFKVLLYDFTPKHRDLFIQAVQDSVYHNALFNRVIKDFVVQGGEHDIDIEIREKAIPVEKRKRFPAEFHPKAFHKIGVLGAGRDDNTAKASFLNQIYFVVGKPVTENDLELLAKKKNIIFTDEQRKAYLEQGGLPRLDGDYTVFGEVYEGYDILKKISLISTDKLDYPVDKVVFKVEEIK